MSIAPGAVVGGKYTLERPLARGGMGSVWVARHTTLGNPVAVKFIDVRFVSSPVLVARFEREARAAANLDTPHVVRVNDYGVERGLPYLVMELLRGEDLASRIRERKRLSLPEASTILSQLGRAIRRAHERGIVHRDLKPANIFLAKVEDDEVVKVLDFGIAKETWSRLDDATRTGEVFGSPHCMSPEQARAQKDVDHRADIWAAGVIAYQMLTGRLPFPGEFLGQVISSVLTDAAPSVTSGEPALPAALDGFFSRALAKRREERFSTITELTDAFRTIAEESGVGVSEVAPPTKSAVEVVDVGAGVLQPPLDMATVPLHSDGAPTGPLPVSTESFTPVGTEKRPEERVLAAAAAPRSSAAVAVVRTGNSRRSVGVIGGIAIIGVVVSAVFLFRSSAVSSDVSGAETAPTESGGGEPRTTMIGDDERLGAASGEGDLAARTTATTASAAASAVPSERPSSSAEASPAPLPASGSASPQGVAGGSAPAVTAPPTTTAKGRTSSTKTGTKRPVSGRVPDDEWGLP
ncbi:MAG: serine/threonine-protein kinase [Polyangiaceae bacterium]